MDYENDNGNGELGEREEDLPDSPIRIVGFDETESVYAIDAYIAVDPGALHLVFTRFVPPPIVTSSDQLALEEHGFVANRVVARVVIPTFLAERMLRSLADRLEYQRQLIAADPERDDIDPESEDAPR